MHRNFRWMHLAASVAPFAVHATTAFAQADGATAAKPAIQAASSANAANGDIVVTAQRRSESLQKVPLSVTAVTMAQIEKLNLTTTDTLQLITPGLVFNKGYTYAQTYIRGVGSNYPNPGLEGAVATYVDGAYLARNFGTINDLFDTGTVEILKGPQGTLYGRNATGGAILLTTADPVDNAEGHIEAEYGRFNHAQIEAVANLPVTDTLAIRVGGRANREDGYVTNLYDGSKFYGRKSYTVRGKAKWTPNADFSAVLGVEYSHSEDRSGGNAERAAAPTCLGCAIPGGGAAPVVGFYNADDDVNVPFPARSFNVNLKLRYNTGIFRLESISSYRDQSSNISIDTDYTRIPLFDFTEAVGGKTYTQDLQVSTESKGWLNGIVGASYLRDDSYLDAILSGGAFAALQTATGAFPASQNTVNTRSYSAFGEIYLTPVERLKITLGGRYTHDTRHLDGTVNPAALLAFAPPDSPENFAQQVKFNSFTPRAVIAYDTGAVNLYASYNRGFKAGGFNTPAFAATNNIEPEKIDSYELGAKFVSSDRKLNLNTALFHYDYSNVQVSIIDVNSGGATIQNAAKARGNGIETDMTYRPARWLQVLAGGAYLDAKFTKYENASVAIETASGLVNGTEDLSGTRLTRAPKFTAYLGTDITVPFGDWVGTLNGIVRYSSSYDFAPGGGGPSDLDVQPAYTVANVTGNIGPADGKYKIGFYVDNLTDTKYYIQRSTSAPFGVFDNVAKPRTYGVRVRYDF